MQPIGPKSNISPRAVLLVGIIALLGTSVPARALDIFTLWHQQEIPLDLTPGSWVDYRSQVMAAGRQDTDLTRVVCLSSTPDSPAGTLVFEIMPLAEDDKGALHPRPGQGVWLLVSADVSRRQGALMDAVLEAWQWDGGVARELSLAELREDPLAAETLRSAFVAERVDKRDATTRIIAGQQFLCEQLVMSAADTQSVTLPAGKMTQISVHEVTAAYNPQLPLLGLAYATERISFETKFDSPNPRVRPPGAKIRVEVMEMVNFGHDAKSLLGRGH